MVFRILGRLLSIADIIAIIVILFAVFLPQKIILYSALYLILKGGFFFLVGKDLMSLFDVACGMYIVMLMFGVSFNILTIAAVLFLGQKALMGLL